MEIGRALCDDEITEKRAGLLMYQQQLALFALKGITFKQTDERAMVREVPGGTRQHSRSDHRGIGTSGHRKGMKNEKARATEDTEVREERNGSDTTSGGNGSTDRNVGLAAHWKPQISNTNAGEGMCDSGSTPGLNELSAMDSGLNGREREVGMSGHRKYASIGRL
jgi:hypothetical protein